MNKFYYKKLRIILLHFLIISLFAQCKLGTYHAEQLHGLWLGINVEYIMDVPMPVLNEYRPDGTMTAKRLGKEAKVYPWVLNQNTLTIDTTHSHVIALSQDSFTYKTKYNFLLRRVKEAPIQKDEGELRSFLKNTSWTSEGRELHFDKEKIYTISEKELTEIRCWNIEKYKDYAFLYQTGHSEDCSISTGRVMQIIKAEGEQLHLSVWNEIDKYDLIYTKKKEVVNFDNLLNNKPFHRCSMNGIIGSGNIGSTYQGGGNAIRNHFYNQYNVSKNAIGENGFLIIKFVANCKAETGEFEFTGMDKNYKPYEFHPDISTQLIDLTRTLDKWIPYEYEGTDYDNYKVINFRIINGQIKVVI